MAHDDMNVVMYKLLAYLYDCQRRGIEPQRSMLAHDGSMLAIPHNYWADVGTSPRARGSVCEI